MSKSLPIVPILSQIAGPKLAAMVPQAWFATPAGRHLAGLERRALDAMVADVFGYFALQVGLPAMSLLDGSPIGVRCRVGRSRSCDVVADPRSLPFSSSSTDLVVVAHELEFTCHPQAVVREAFRVLRPEGSLVVLCFNPRGLYGLRRLFDRAGQYPWHGDFISAGRLRDWLTVLGLTARYGGQLGYAPPWLAGEGDWLRDRLEEMGDRWWPMLGGVHIVKAIKRVPATRRIRPAWGNEVKEALPAGVAELSSRTAGQ